MLYYAEKIFIQDNDKCMDFYYTVEQRATAEFKDRGSRFIACIIPLASVNDFKKELEAVKKEYPKAKLTLWPTGGHDAWTKATSPSYKENGMNMYEWMLQYHK